MSFFTSRGLFAAPPPVFPLSSSFGGQLASADLILRSNLIGASSTRASLSFAASYRIFRYRVLAWIGSNSRKVSQTMRNWLAGNNSLRYR